MEDDVIPDNNMEYSTREYWEARYKKDPKPFDWFKGYAELADILKQVIKESHSILMVGCGNSTLSEDMYKDNFQNITNIDFSKEVITQMSERCKEYSKMLWLEMDVRELKFADGSFDICIDKGTMDALLFECEQTSAWEVEDSIAENIHKMLSEISRVLKPDGVYIYITFGQPHFRKKLLMKDCYNWTLELKTIGDFFHYFVYILRKNLSKITP